MAGQERDLLAVAAATVLPEVYAAEADVDPWRQRLDRNLRALHDAGTSLPADRPPIATLFLLVYQGREDRALMEAFSRLFPTPAEPAAVAPAGGGRKIRVGFVSRNFYSHTVGTLNIGLVERLDREKFEVFVFCVGEYTDRLNARFRRAADRYVTLPLSLPAARDMVRSHACDILFYTDLGMDAVTYGMAHARLAPVQCTTWGHPVTSGSTTVDYFVSTAMAESADAQAHYTERLALLPRLSVYYTRPPAPPPADVRAELGLPADAHLYGCLQTVWKFHPEFDRLLAEVLRRDPAGQLLVIRSTNEDVERQRRERWERVMPDVAGRIRSLPRMPIADFLNVVRACDVLLDPIHFGGGNTTYEAFAFGVPVVTLPSPFLRGRFTLAMYRTLGVDDCVVSNAAEYVELAVRLANDPAYRSQVSGKILAAGDRLFQDESAVRAMEEFFESVARRQSRM
jgi:predicted O-linked N-acetylglucosamine transferase (SPINDLY family)